MTSYLNGNDVANLLCNQHSYSKAIKDRLDQLGVPIKGVGIARNSEFEATAHSIINIIALALIPGRSESLSIETSFCISPLTTAADVNASIFQISNSLKEKYDNHIKNQ